MRRTQAGGAAATAAFVTGILAASLIHLPPTIAAAPEAASTAPAPPLPLVEIEPIMKRLGSDEFAVREAAQRELDKLPPEQRAELVVLIQQEKDPEVKARLQQRLAQIDEYFALHPAPLTLHVKNASPQDLMAAINQAPAIHESGVALVTLATSDFTLPGGGFTVDADRKPFWDVMLMLADQGIGQGAWSRGSSTFPVTMPHTAYDRHDSFIALVRNLTRSIDLVPGSRAPSTLSLMMVVQADPRVRILAAAPPRWIAADDDGGHSLLAPATNPPQGFTPGTQTTWTYSQTLKLPENVGKKFSIKAESRLQVLVAKREESVDNIDTHIGEKLTVGGLTVTLQRLNNTPTATTVQVAIQQEPFSGDASRPSELAIYDGAGKIYSFASFIEGRTGTTTTSGTSAGPHNGPFKLVVTVADRIKTVTVPIEIKDVPIP